MPTFGRNCALHPDVLSTFKASVGDTFSINGCSVLSLPPGSASEIFQSYMVLGSVRAREDTHYITWAAGQADFKYYVSPYAQLRPRLTWPCVLQQHEFVISNAQRTSPPTSTDRISSVQTFPSKGFHVLIRESLRNDRRTLKATQARQVFSRRLVSEARTAPIDHE